jgi:hypothetical protein
MEKLESFVVVLGFFSGQISDVVTKDLIEPVADNYKASIKARLLPLLPNTSGPRLMFL